MMKTVNLCYVVEKYLVAYVLLPTSLSQTLFLSSLKQQFLRQLIDSLSLFEHGNSILGYSR